MQQPAPSQARSRWLRRFGGMLAAVAIAVLAGCASNPLHLPQRDGPEPNPPADLVKVPDAEPKLEPIRPGGANKPYDVLGKTYVPITQDAPYTERGLASWYGRAFHGKRTASGEIYNMYAMTAAHPTLPIPSYARIRNPANGREVVVRINDRGPFHVGRIVDLSYTAALKLDLLRGVAPVEVQRITFEEIRTGAWRRDGGSSDAVVLAASTSTSVNPNVNPNAGAQNADSERSSMSAQNVPVPAALVAPVAVAQPAAAPTSVMSGPPGGDVVSNAPAAGALSESVAASAVVASSRGNAVIADAPAARAFTTQARGFWVQLGAFKARDGAESFQHRVAAELDWLSPLLAVFSDASMYRLQAGPYPTRDEARGVAERVRTDLQLVPVIVERR